jgi:hypothetical protein
MSGMTAVPGWRDELLAVWDSAYAESRIFTIDPTKEPARITGAVTIQGGTGNYDAEGIVVAPDGSYWIASEGNAGARLNRLLQVDPGGVLLNEIMLPDEIEDCRAASNARGTLGSGFEGLAAFGSPNNYYLYVAQQRGWEYTTPECEALDDVDESAGKGRNANGEPLYTRIWIYHPSSGRWGHIEWELAELPENAAWVGLSEITFASRGLHWIVIERDSLTGDWTELKTLARVLLWDVVDGTIERKDKSVFDLLPAMREGNGWITDKPEGVAVDGRDRLYLVTDNDGVDEWSGETSFLRLGDFRKLFRSGRRH